MRIKTKEESDRNTGRVWRFRLMMIQMMHNVVAGILLRDDDDTAKKGQQTKQECLQGVDEEYSDQLNPSKWPLSILSPIGEGARRGGTPELVVARLCFASRGKGKF